MSSSREISVVIPTLGGPSLAGTINRLNAGTLIPSEILVCIPDSEPEVTLSGDNVRVLRTPFRGQVAQRAFGFKEAKSPFVLQIDDDMDVAPGCVEALLAGLKGLAPQSAVSPALFLRDTGEYAYSPYWDSRLIRARIELFLLNGPAGYEPGRISRAGYNFPPRFDAGIQETQWLPGGCVLHRRENLVLESFYPWPGKAYAEDLFHSYTLRLRGIRLYVNGAAKCFFDWGEVDPASARIHDRRNRAALRRFAVFAGKNPLRLDAYHAWLWMLSRLRLMRAIARRVGTLVKRQPANHTDQRK